MCNVCAATSALRKGGLATKWSGDGGELHVEAKGKGPEGKPCEYRIRRNKDEQWSGWSKTNDLAFVMGYLGTDVKWDFVGPLTRRYLDGQSTAAQVMRRIRDQEVALDIEMAGEVTIYTQFLSDGSAKLSSFYSNIKRVPEYILIDDDNEWTDAAIRTLSGLYGHLTTLREPTEEL